MKIIITGGVGYIGSHVVLAALDRGYDVTVFDDLSTANKKNINLKTKFIQGSINSKEDLLKLFANNKYDANAAYLLTTNGDFWILIIIFFHIGVII